PCVRPRLRPGKDVDVLRSRMTEAGGLALLVDLQIGIVQDALDLLDIAADPLRVERTFAHCTSVSGRADRIMRPPVPDEGRCPPLPEVPPRRCLVGGRCRRRIPPPIPSLPSRRHVMPATPRPRRISGVLVTCAL